MPSKQEFYKANKQVSWQLWNMLSCVLLGCCHVCWVVQVLCGSSWPVALLDLLLVLSSSCWQPAQLLSCSRCNRLTPRRSHQPAAPPHSTLPPSPLTCVQGTSSSKKRKQAKLQRVMAAVKKHARREASAVSEGFAAVHLLHDPQAFVERLFARLQGSRDKWESRTAMMAVTSRCDWGSGAEGRVRGGDRGGLWVGGSMSGSNRL